MVSVQDSKFGKGLFASVNIPKNTIVLQISIEGNRMNFEDTIRLEERESHTLQIGPDQYIMCEEPFLYTNHACEPNCGITPNMELKTLRAIENGEELFWDYSTSMLERHWTLNCRCGFPNCRGLITDFDLLPPKLQQKFIRMDIVIPFILEAIRTPVYTT
jgi:uncharacterized protein